MDGGDGCEDCDEAQRATRQMADEQRSVHGVRFVDSPFSDSSTGTFPEIRSRRQISIRAALFAFACVLLAPARGQLVDCPSAMLARPPSCLVVDPHYKLTFASSVPTDIVLSSSRLLGICTHLTITWTQSD